MKSVRVGDGFKTSVRVDDVSEMLVGVGAGFKERYVGVGAGFKERYVGVGAGFKERYVRVGAGFKEVCSSWCWV